MDWWRECRPPAAIGDPGRRNAGRGPLRVYLHVRAWRASGCDTTAFVMEQPRSQAKAGIGAEMILVPAVAAESISSVAAPRGEWLRPGPPRPLFRLRR